MGTITKTQLENASVDANDFASIVNGPENATINTRLGQSVATVAKAIASLKSFNYRGAWVTATAYALKDVVIVSGVAYVAVIAHTSAGSFATDLSAGKWAVHQGVTVEEFGKAVTFVTPEMFGVPGAGANDNTLIANAVGSGHVVLAYGPLYKLNSLVLTIAPNIIFGPQTEIRNMQAGGSKNHAMTVQGGYTGSAIVVTGFDLINSGGTVTTIGRNKLSKTIRVANGSSFAAGDTIRIYEDGPINELSTITGFAGETQDFNYREFATIATVAGNVITTREFLRFPYRATRTVSSVDYTTKIRKVAFVENPCVKGGVWTGGNPAGGGIAFEFCRDGYAGEVKGRGLSSAEADFMGGAVVTFKDCWESHRGPISARWTLFTHYSMRNQACHFGPVHGSKWTLQGGMYVSGDCFCTYDLITQDAPGFISGDQIGLANGARCNIFAGILGTGSNCYGMIIRQGCDDNIISALSNFNGITVGLQDFAERSNLKAVKLRGNPAGGVVLGGNGTIIDLDVDCEANAVLLLGNQRGLRITGSAKSSSSDPQFFDLLIGNLVRDSVIDLQCGTKGAGYSGAAVVHHSNEIIVSGPKPYVMQSRLFNGGKAFRNSVRPLVTATGLSSIPIKIPGYIISGGIPMDTADGLINLPLEPSDQSIIYEINLTRSIQTTGYYSKYTVLTRQNEFAIMKSEIGTATIPSFVPKLRINTTTSPATLELYVDTETALTIIVDIRKV